MGKRIRAADLFCGAGGTSTGLALACEELGLRVDLLAINHWDVAIRTHEANHPWATHICKSLHEVDPRKAVPGGRLDVLVASPECTHHSIARGGRPVSDQMRMSAWQVVDWLSALRVESVIIENVREFRDWGPLDSRGRPLRSRRGETYQAFLGAIRSLGYRVEDRLLNAADYGDPTTRTRLFILARRGRKPITWPQPTHYPTPLLGERWVPAREIIDWSIKGESIFTRRRPLSANTLARITAGLKRFGGIGFVLPPLGYYHRNGDANRPRSLERPVQTITSRGGGHLVEPFLVNLRGTDLAALRGTARSVEESIPALTTERHVGVVEPFILPHRMFDGQQVDSVDRPLRTIVGQNGGDIGLVQPFLVRYNGERPGETPRTHSVEEPIPVIDTSNRYGLAEPFMVQVNHGGNGARVRSVDQPVPVVTTTHGLGLVEAFLLKYHGTGGARSVDEPLDTVTTRDRFALVEIDGVPYALDVRFRMLQPAELARAMGFPAGYGFAGTRAQQVRQIGNAVAVRTAQALCRSVLE